MPAGPVTAWPAPVVVVPGDHRPGGPPARAVMEVRLGDGDVPAAEEITLSPAAVAASRRR